MKKTLVFFLLITSLLLNAQKKEKNYAVKAGINFTPVIIKDDALSPMTYKGNAKGVNIDIIERTNSYDDILKLNFKSGILIPPFDNDTKADMIHANIDWYHTYIYNTTDATTTYIGWNFNSSFAMAKHNLFPNNPAKYITSLSIGPSLKFDYHPAFLSDNIKLDFLGGCSLINYIIRPSVSAWEPTGYGDYVGKANPGYLLGGKIKFMNHFQRIHTVTSISYFFTGKLAFTGAYSWDFVHLKADDELFSTEHEFFAGILFKI
jgi:hypothetical protein